MAFHKIKRGTPCPVCSDTQGRCVDISDDSTAIICWKVRTSLDICPPGWKFIKEAAKDMGGIIVVEKEKEFKEYTKEEKIAWAKEQQDKRDRAEAKRLAELNELLSIPTRNRYYQAVKKVLKPLSYQHKCSLLNRGLQEKEIAQLIEWGWVQEWQANKIYQTEGIGNLPGFDKFGKSQLKDGFVIWKHDHQGNIVNGEIALDDRRDGKYRPLSSAHCGGKGPQLPNGEIPVAVWRHPEAKRIDYVILTEGVLKSLVCAVKHWRANKNIVVIGKTNIGSSHQTVNEYLSQLRKEYDFNQIVLMPDAGAIDHKEGFSNPMVINAYAKIWESLKGLSWLCLNVGWWGQTKKSSPVVFPFCDIDELSNFQINEIKYLWPSDFFAMAKVKPQRNPQNNLQKNTEAVNYFASDFGQEPDAGEYARYRAAEDYENYINNIQTHENWIQRTVRIIRKFSTQKSYKNRTNKKSNTGCDKWQSEVKVFSGEIVKTDKSQTYIYKDGEFFAALKEAIASGYKYILDASGTGAGKTYQVSSLQKVSSLGDFETAFYLSPGHRNPTVAGLEEDWVDLPPRHNGLVYDRSRITGAGSPFVVRPRTDEERENPDIQGNCRHANLFNLAAEYNLDKVLGSDNPICNACPKFHQCQNLVGTGKGYGFRYQRRVVLGGLDDQFAAKFDKIRAHISSLPDADDYSYDKALGILDEPKAWLEGIKKIAIEKDDFYRAAALISRNKEIFPKVEDLLYAIIDLFEGKFDEELGRFGFDDPKTRELLLGKLPQVDHVELLEIAGQIENYLFPDLSWLNTIDEINTKGMSQAEKRLIWSANKALREASAIDNEEAEREFKNDVAKNFVPDLIRVLAGNRGALSFKKGCLEIAIPDKRITKTLNAFKTLLFLDATIHPEDLATLLGCDVNEILILQKEGTEKHIPANLEVVQILGMGQLGKIRSDALKERVKKLRGTFDELYGENVGHIDWKDCAKEDDGQYKTLTWFNGSRGSNQFEQLSALVIWGIPRPSLSAMAQKYQTLTGKVVELTNPDPAFSDFYNRSIQEEIWQAIGRLRATRRDEKLKVFIAYDDPDFSLDFLGANIFQISAGELNPEAGTTAEQNKFLIAKALQSLAATTPGKITQKMIAEHAQLSQSTVSRMTARWWKKFMQSAISITKDDLHKLYEMVGLGSRHLIDELKSQIGAIYQDPSLLAKTARQHGEHIAMLAIHELGEESKVKFLESVLALLPLPLRLELFEEFGIIYE